MWLPGLAIFTFLALFPTGLSILLNYFHTSQGFVAIFFFIVIGVILYSGRRLHDLILSSILTETENRKLLQKLARERNAAEACVRGRSGRNSSGQRITISDSRFRRWRFTCRF